jgi:tetratricopeptide (TPR) repeat protein
LVANLKDDLRYFLAAAYVEKEALDQAVVEFKKILPESNLFADSRRSILLILKKQNKVEEAVQVMEDALLVKPKDADLYLILRL